MKKVEAVQFDYAHTQYLYYIPEVYHHCTLNNFDFYKQYKLVPILKNFIEGTAIKRGLYFFGSFGVGKSHLLVSLYRIIVSKEDDSSPDVVYYVSFENAIKELRSREKEYSQEYLELLCECGWLFLDDLSVVPIKDYSAEALRTIINSRYESKLPTCFAANLDPTSLENLHPHAGSRIRGMCEIVRIIGRDRRR